MKAINDQVAEEKEKYSDSITGKVEKVQVIAENKCLEKLIEEKTSQLIASNKELKKEIASHTETLEVLRKSEENHTEIFNKASDAIFVNELGTGNIVDVNRKACMITGFTKEEFINGNPADFAPLEYNYSLKKADEKIREVVANGDQNFEWRFRYKDGSVHWIEVSMTIAYIAGIKRVLSFFHEIDDRKEAEQKLDDERSERQTEITNAVIYAEEKERQYIGQELHDNIQQILNTSRLYLDIAKKTEVKQKHPYIDEVRGMICKAITELRNLSHTMISPFLDGQSLFDALHHLVKMVSKSSGLAINIAIENINEKTIPDKVKLAIYRIAQEQFTNVVKHAKAKKVELKFSGDGTQMLLSIKDDGIGFDTSKKTKGFGLINLKTRASLCNGQMHIISSVGNGCELIVNFNCD